MRATAIAHPSLIAAVAAGVLLLGACASDDGEAGPADHGTVGAFVLTFSSEDPALVVVLDLMLRSVPPNESPAWARAAAAGAGPTSVRLPCDAALGDYTLEVYGVGVYDAVPASLGGIFREPPEGGLDLGVVTSGVVTATCVGGVDTAIDLGPLETRRRAKQGFVDLSVDAGGPLSVGDAAWDVGVSTVDGVRVWLHRVMSSEHGDGLGAFSYVGSCSAEDGDGPNRVFVALRGLYAASLREVPRDPSRPVPPGSLPFWGPVELARDVSCVMNQDLMVTFGVVVGLREGDGVHDDLVRVGDTRCDVAWTCAGGPALHVACVAPTAPVVLMDDLVVRCDDGGDDVVIDPTVAGEVVEREVDAGVEARWTVPVEVAAERLGGASCHVATRVTPAVATPTVGESVAGSAIPAGLLYPLLTLDAALGAACEPARPSDAAGTSLRVTYTSADPASGDTVLDHASR